MFKTVLVPLDGSSLAERAIDVAIPIAVASDAELHLATVRRHIPRADARPDDIEQLYLDRTAGFVAHRIGRPVTPVMLVDVIAGRPLGEPPRRAVADVLEDYVRQYPIDLTVMTTHGRSGLSRAYMGSVADAFMRYSPSPVLMFKPADKQIGIGNLLVLLDGTAEASTIVQPAIDLALALSARCTLLRIIPPGSDPYEATKQLADRWTAFHAAGVPVQTEVRMSDNPAAAIIVYATTNGVDAIALTTRTRNPLQRMFLGSVADTLMRKAGKPMLICNPFSQTTSPVAEQDAGVMHGH